MYKGVFSHEPKGLLVPFHGWFEFEGGKGAILLLLFRLGHQRRRQIARISRRTPSICAAPSVSA